MLKRILIHRSPAFEDIELYMQGGFNVFSGASGSGKSVFMASMLAILGIAESNADLIEANIDTKSLKVHWDELGIPNEDEEIVLSILKKDKIRYFINHASSSKKKLFDIVSGFAKHISTKSSDELSPNALLRLFDSFICAGDSKHKSALESFRRNYEALQKAKKDLAILEEEASKVAQLKEFAQFEVQKIENLNPKEGQYEELLALKKMLSKQEKIRESLQKVKEALAYSAHFETFLQLIDENCPSLIDGLNDIESLALAQESRLEELEVINENELLDKISALSELMRRFGSVAEALEYCKIQKANLQKYDNIHFDKQKLQKLITELESATKAQAEALHATRLKFIKLFATKLNALCESLKLPKCEITLESVPLNTQGASAFRLKLAHSEISNISSGEYNRLRLCVMCIDAEIEKKSGILILDEVDANLSGEESQGVAKILKNLSKHYQIFAISHQTHMPSLADRHFLVEKNGAKSTIRELDMQGRIYEIARMISGSEITPEALEFAKKHLNQH